MESWRQRHHCLQIIMKEIHGKRQKTMPINPKGKDIFRHNLPEAKESLALLLMGITQATTNTLLINESLPAGEGKIASFINWYSSLTSQTHQGLNTLFLILFISLLGWLASGRRLTRQVLDLWAAFLILRFGVQFLLINALIFTPTVSISLLMGQVILIIPAFILSWGWIFYRIDFIGKSRPQTIIQLQREEPPITSFDYYYSTITSIVDWGVATSAIKGITRGGRILVTIYKISALDLIGLTLGRAYQLFQSNL